VILSVTLLELPRILVADDDEEVVQQIAAALTPLGYRVEVAGDGREALERLRAEAFDLLILDVMMPRMDGIEVLQAIQEQPLARPLPVIVLVAPRARVDDNERIRTWVCGLGAADVIVKYRLKEADIIQTVQRVLWAKGEAPASEGNPGIA
jgi:CheY-like chemotaxis protein